MLSLVIRVAGLLVLGFGAGFIVAASSSSSTGTGANGVPKVIVIDQQSVLRTSLAGQEIARQAATLRDQIQKEVAAEQQAIVKSQNDLQKNSSVYSPAQRERKLKALEARQRAYPIFEQRKGRILQVSVNQATEKVAAALRPILQEIINENKATLLLDRGQVMYAAPSYDMTAEAIKRLNASLKTVKVERVNLDSLNNDQTPSPGTAPAPSVH